MQKHINKLTRWGICVLLILMAALQANGNLPTTLIEKVDYFIYDLRMRWEPTTFNPDIVIVNIDEKSLQEVGQWPWNRGVVADLIERLTDDYHVRAVGLDIVFSEPDNSTGIQVLEGLAQKELKENPGFVAQMPALRKELDFDDRLAKTLAGRPVVLGYVFSNTPDDSSKGLLPPPPLLMLT
ncbi:hypothetical protein UNDYM_1010 [Undibacterium sp. YM2]|uniref:CHASE2 domain-containing protein n=1 Tax=Undibacterium sp. YM2 TaxID=2058625 RepID=UPI001331D231|nr:CHASE2 domain-containing protein [Undibacterium sp. YM2]BBB65263.1 hypothetical protein UNDYM_1010 [Undibacterium sp. YM2]